MTPDSRTVTQQLCCTQSILCTEISLFWRTTCDFLLFCVHIPSLLRKINFYKLKFSVKNCQFFFDHILFIFRIYKECSIKTETKISAVHVSTGCIQTPHLSKMPVEANMWCTFRSNRIAVCQDTTLWSMIEKYTLRRKMDSEKNNTHPHVLQSTLAYLEEKGIQLVPHSLCSPDMAPCDFYFFPTWKRSLKDVISRADKKYNKCYTGYIDQDVEERLQSWVSTMDEALGKVNWVQEGALWTFQNACSVIFN